MIAALGVQRGVIAGRDVAASHADVAVRSCAGGCVET
jgi:hypothetical protein